jgi:atypical dual specificity phosphatase
VFLLLFSRLITLKSFCEREGLQAVEIPARRPFFRIRKAHALFLGKGKNSHGGTTSSSRQPKQLKLVQVSKKGRRAQHSEVFDWEQCTLGANGTLSRGGSAAQTFENAGRGGTSSTGWKTSGIPVGMSGVLAAHEAVLDGVVAAAETEGEGGSSGMWLYLGSALDARDKTALRAHRIRYVLNCCAEMDTSWAASAVGARYLRLRLLDESFQTLRPALETGLDFIAQAERDRASILVHCIAGRSRSASVVLYWLMRRCSLRLADALRFLRSRRNSVSPNPGFLRQLRQIEREIFGLPATEPIDDLVRILTAAPSPPLSLRDLLPPQLPQPSAEHSPPAQTEQLPRAEAVPSSELSTPEELAGASRLSKAFFPFLSPFYC